MNQTLSATTGVLYKKVAKPILFKFDPEKVHDATLSAARISSNIWGLPTIIDKAYSFQDPLLKQTVHGITYKNPLGLAAGWDKNAQAVSIMSSLGFGFVEVGSITKHSYEGNKGRRLWRLPESKSIVVNYGLKNEGVDDIAPRIKRYNSSIPIGTNIARTNSPDCDDVSSIEDYVYSFKMLSKIGNYFTVNISCPNTFGGQPFHDKERLHALLGALDEIPTKKPVYVKISPDITQKERKDIAALAFKHRVDGFICGNLTKNRTLDSIYETELPNTGGLSGKVVEDVSNELLSDMYMYTKGQKTIIGLGGIFTAKDAYKKIKLGASLVQLMTGLIYQGPQTVGQINHDLVTLLNNDGYHSITEVIGAEK